MKQKHRIFLLLLWLVYGTVTMAQTDKSTILKTVVDVHQQNSGNTVAVLDAQREKGALLIFLKSVQTQIVSAAEAMPADKYSFAPTEGEFKGVRTFGQQVKHLAATNHILAAAALGEQPPADAGDEQGPENVRTKSELLDYLNGSFAHLGEAIDAIGDSNAMVKSSPISPLPASKTTRLADCRGVNSCL